MQSEHLQVCEELHRLYTVHLSFTFAGSSLLLDAITMFSESHSLSPKFPLHSMRKKPIHLYSSSGVYKVPFTHSHNSNHHPIAKSPYPEIALPHSRQLYFDCIYHVETPPVSQLDSSASCGGNTLGQGTKNDPMIQYSQSFSYHFHIICRYL